MNRLNQQDRRRINHIEHSDVDCDYSSAEHYDLFQIAPTDFLQLSDRPHHPLIPDSSPIDPIRSDESNAYTRPETFLERCSMCKRFARRRKLFGS